jgi:cell division protease FtsH
LTSAGPPGRRGGKSRSKPTARTSAFRKVSATRQARQIATEVLQRVLGVVLKDPLSTLLLIGAAVLTILFFSLLGSTRPSSPGQAVPLSEVTKLAAQKQLSQATLLDQDSRVVVRTKDGRELWAAYPQSDAQTSALLKSFKDAGTSVSIDQQSSKPTSKIVVQFLLPILILVCLFAFFMRIGQDSAAGGFAAFSKLGARGKKKKRGSGTLSFADVAGAGEAVAELKEIRDYLADPSRYARLGAMAPKGVLLVGPPGTGKTLIARATSGEAEAAFFSLSGSEFVESLVGVGAARVRDLFQRARKAAPAIVFIDELDAAGRRRGAGIGQGNDEREQTLNQLLVEMDGFDADAGIVVMGATNRPDILDPALLRPGRFDRQVTIDVPDVHGRHEILELHCGSRPLSGDASLIEIAKLTPGFTGAELANVINEAALLTVREGHSEITQAILEEAIDRVVAGPAKKSHVLTQAERWIIAVHEASHAVVTRSIGQTVAAQKLSIVSRGRQLGTAAHMLTDRDRAIAQEPDLNRQLCSIVAGAAGERIEYGFLSSGVHDDLHAATQLARRMVTSFGMSEALGPVTIGERDGEVFLGASLQDLGSVGASTLDLIDGEVERLVGEALEKAGVILERNWATVEETAQALIEHETLSGVALEAVLSTVHSMALDGISGARRANGVRRPARER